MRAEQKPLVIILLVLLGIASLMGVLMIAQYLKDRLMADAETKLSISEFQFTALDGWASDNHVDALKAFLLSCAPLKDQPDDRPFGGGGYELQEGQPLAGYVRDWREVCKAAEAASGSNEISARAFFETHFTPLRIQPGRGEEPRFTGYYEAELRGAKQPTTTYATPLYERPDDLVHVELGQFREDLKGQRIAGRVIDGHLRPYETRAEIESGNWEAPSDVIAWVDDPVQAFSLHVQGSGRVVLEDGSVLRVGYAGQNGHKYKAIGAVLINQGEVAREDMSWDAIKAWIAENPDKAQDLMNENPSYIFFRELDISDPELGPLGSQGVPLTPGRSLAIDRRYFGLGMPLWLETEVIKPDQEDGQIFRHLMITQDTGGAIKGVIRGDIFFGFGAPAEELAGYMNAPGSLVALLPNELAYRLLTAESK